MAGKKMRKRAPKGSNNPRRREDGTWEGRVYVARKRYSVYGATKAEAEEKMFRLKVDHDRGINLDPKQNLSEYLTEWLAGRIGDLRPATLVGYEQIVRCHLIPILGDVRLDTLATQHVRAMLANLRSKKLSAATRRKAHAVLRAALEQACGDKLISENVAAAVKAPRLPASEPVAFSVEEVNTLLDHARGDRLEALFVLAVTAGLRQGELLGLRWTDVDLEARRLQVRYALKTVRARGESFVDRSAESIVPLGDSRLYLGEPKTRRSRRLVPLTNVAVQALSAHRERQIVDRDRAGLQWQDHDLVFTTRRGGPIHPRNAVRTYYRLRDQAELPILSFHALRATAASLMALKRLHPRVVMAVMGHTDVRTTMHAYTKVLEESLEDAAAMMDDLLTSEEIAAPRTADRGTVGVASCHGRARPRTA